MLHHHPLKGKGKIPMPQMTRREDWAPFGPKEYDTVKNCREYLADTQPKKVTYQQVLRGKTEIPLKRDLMGFPRLP